MKHFPLFLLSIISFISINAQTTKELLSNKDWCIEGTNGYVSGLRFEGNDAICFIEYEGRHETRNPYYFDDIKASTFDSSKIGAKTAGKYIIIRNQIKNFDTNQWENAVLPLKIHKITTDRLEVITPYTGTIIVHYAR